MTKGKRGPKRGVRVNDHGLPKRVVPGDPFTKADIDIERIRESVDTEFRAKVRVTTILVVALVVLYAAYMGHEWYVKNSFVMIGEFLQNALIAFISWCFGKGSLG